jgi:hypothetical protein
MASDEQKKRATDELKMLRLLRDHPGWRDVVLPALVRRREEAREAALDIDRTDAATREAKVRARAINECIDILDDLERSCISTITAGE